MQCPKNYYANGKICSRCSNNRLTSAAGATSSRDCYEALSQAAVIGITVAIFVAIAIITTLVLLILSKTVARKKVLSIKKAGVAVLDSQKKPDVMGI